MNIKSIKFDHIARDTKINDLNNQSIAVDELPKILMNSSQRLIINSHINNHRNV